MVESQLGSFVNNYFEEDLPNTSHRRWKRVNLGSPVLCNLLQDILSARHIPISDSNDCIFWCGSKTGEYKVNLGYHVQREQGSVKLWPHNLCWNKRLLPKASAFLWTALHNRILTGDRLKHIGISGSDWCIMCKSVEETANHLLFNRSIAETCWNWYFRQINLTTVRNESLLEFLFAWPTCFNSKWSDLWLIGPFMITWHIWRGIGESLLTLKSLWRSSLGTLNLPLRKLLTENTKHKADIITYGIKTWRESGT
ncbi:hypothetical protein SUGI_0050380 [Cryptomeria japonica]|nr:hypothetical protein SUGI_0050380 [Cryptomeria japonica]